MPIPTFSADSDFAFGPSAGLGLAFLPVACRDSVERVSVGSVP